MGSAHKAYRFTMLALWLWAVVHAVALLTMVAWLQPGMDAGRSVAERMAYVAQHPWSWRLGWLPWQLCALTDIALSAGLLRWLSARDARSGVAWAWAGLALTAVAVVPDQWGELVMVTDQLDAAVAGDLVVYDAVERWTLLMTGTCGSSGYLFMTVAWMMALSEARPMDRAARVMWGIGAAAILPFIGSAAVIALAVKTPALDNLPLVVPLNGIAFPLLLVWTFPAAVVMGRIHHGDHPRADEALQRFRWPRNTRLAWLWEALAEPGMRDLLRALPFVELHSDVVDVVYLNWMVPCDRAAKLLPPPLALRRFGAGPAGGEDRTPLSILTYAHGDFGPAFLGALRKPLPSPLQSNWRLYLDGADAIFFIKTTLSSPIHALGSRLLSDGLPAHLALSFEHRRDGERIATVLTSGEGSAPDLRATVVEQTEATLPPQFAACFEDWNAAVAYLTAQNGAVSSLPALGGVFTSAIDIPIDVASVRPAIVDGVVDSAFLASLVEGCETLAFVVPRVPFRALGEHRIPTP